MEQERDALLRAASLLQTTLARTAHYLCVKYDLPRLERVHDVPAVHPSPLNFALSYEACGSGALLEVIADTSLVATTTMSHEADAPTLAIQIDAKAATRHMQAYLEALGVQLGVASYNTVVRHARDADKMQTGTETSTDKRTLVLSRRLLASVLPHVPIASRRGVLFLVVLLLPGALDGWHTLRDLLSRDALQRDDAHVEDADDWSLWWSMWILASLVLSHRYKLQEPWQVRGWLVHILSQQGRLSLPDTPHVTQAQRLPISFFLEEDSPLFFFTTAQHVMNYNAWHYRRQCWQACVLQRPSSLTERDNSAAWWAQLVRETMREAHRVMTFLERHNGDISATSYLLTLIHVLAARVTEDDSAQAAVQQLWRTLFAFTQQEIRRHADQGHECMWTLRLGLIDVALSRAKGGCCLDVRNGWTVHDELTWVATYVTVGASESGKDEEESQSPLLLAPVPGATTRQVWSRALTGTPACQSYLAARYGVQLCQRLLRRHHHHAF